MYRFWSGYTKPVIEILRPRRILEIGAEFGQNTVSLLEYCQATGAKLDVVDPVPTLKLQEVLAGYPALVTLHACKSLEAIPSLPAAELVLIDGDHNWFTVYNELQQLYLRAAANGVAPPVVLLHDIAWPYARRDMYYNPDSLDIANRHPYAFRGMLPGQSELSDSGVNGRHANATHEGGPRNGVLTAVEDFQASCGVGTALHLLPFFNGLGILVPDERVTASLQTVIDGFFASEPLLQICQVLDRNVMSARAELAALNTVLRNRTAALARLREELDALNNRKNAVQQATARARNWAGRLRRRVARMSS